MMRSKRGSGVALAILSLFLLLGGMKTALALTLSLSTDKGCGSGAVFQIGETTNIFFGSDTTTNATLILTRPDGDSLLFSGTLQASVTYVITGTAGSPAGPRTLTLTAGATSVTCSYGVGSTPPPGLELNLETSKGCGSGASFQVGETTQFQFSANQTVSATLTLAKPDGTTTTFFNGTLQAGVPQTITGTAGQPTGTRTLTLTSGATSVTCTYDVVSSGPVLAGSVRTNNGCDVSFLKGNPVSIIVNSSLDANARVTLTRPDGTTSLLFNGPVAAGDTTIASAPAGDPTGDGSIRTLQLTLTKPGFTTVTGTCAYDVQSADTLSPGSGG